MEKSLLLLLFLVLGIFCKKKKLLPNSVAKMLNKVLINFFIPILILQYLPNLKFDKSHIWLVITPWIIYLFSFLFFEVFNYLRPIPKSARATLIMTSGIGSISFAGFPIFELFYGQEGLSLGLILSLAGTFVVCNTIGIFTGFWYAQRKTNYSKLVRDILTFPPFMAMIFAVILLNLDIQYTESFALAIKFLGAPFSALALFAVGLNLTTTSFNQNKNYFLLGQGFKLILAPLLIYTVLYFFGENNSLVGKICILGAGLGSMNTIAIVAAELNLRPKLAYLMPGVGIPISIITVILIHFIFL